jgi:crotonobetainyl-CoA:carnitine CoA-transferase CaiB-like acyl-CoA transferase
VTAAKPCHGLTIVELAVGTSELGLGLAGGVPGMILSDLGASVVRIVSENPAPIDVDVPWGRAWHRDKLLISTDDVDTAAAHARAADAVLAYGPEDLVEARGLGYRDLAAVNPGLVYARCRPSRASWGTAEDFGLLVEARSGFCTQLAGHRPGPIFTDVRAPGIGAASLLLVSVLALLARRAGTGEGGWAETSLYDGMLATLGCMIGRSERAAPEIESYWEKGSTFPNFLYRCADGELIQVWFGGKGMYASLIRVLGDEPSTDGYYADQMTGKLGERAARWVSFFAAAPRDEWITRLRAASVACEPVLGPGEILADPHLAETGLALRRGEGDHDDVVAGSPITVLPLSSPSRPIVQNVPSRLPSSHSASPTPASPPTPTSASAATRAGLLAGLRVVDFSAFVAGPLAAEILADLGADVVKVEPPDGEAMRAAAYAGADVVLHNFRVGVAERLGIGEEDVARLNPGAVYCHASAFGTTGRRAAFPGNDALMQAVTGFERAIGGAGNDPIAATWIPIDMAGGWIAAAAVLAGLYARAAAGAGRRVATSLLGAGLLLHSGVFQRDGELAAGPSLDGNQTGYGPGYRIYQGADDQWFALVVPDSSSWHRLASAAADPAALPAAYAPLRGGPADAAARAAEAALEAAFAAAPAAEWVARLRDLGLLAELIEPASRDDFRRAILDDPVNRQLGRVVSYQTADWGHFEQIGPLVRYGPGPADGPRLMLPRVGEHTTEILTELGIPAEDIDALLTIKAARQLAD